LLPNSHTKVTWVDVGSPQLEGAARVSWQRLKNEMRDR